MPIVIPIEGTEPQELPEWQSPESIIRIVEHAKIGDVVHIIPQGNKLRYLLENLGIGQIHGCVDSASTRDKLTLWSTYFCFNNLAFKTGESRSYTPSDIRLIEMEEASNYIKHATNDRFRYGQEVRVRCNDGIHVIVVDSFFDGIMSGLQADGQRITGGLSFFSPYEG